MPILALPPEREMWSAFAGRDAAYDGLFLAGVTTTGIFCRPTCPARLPLRRNVRFFASPAEAVGAGFRPCLRCRPQEVAGTPPEWLRPLLAALEAEPSLRLPDSALRQRGLSPERVRRWFLREHGMTFQAWQRARRVGRALGELSGGTHVVETAYGHGWESVSAFQAAVRRLTGRPPAASRDARVVRLARFESPVGPLLAGADASGLRLLEFAGDDALEARLSRLQRRLGAVLVPGSDDVLAATRRELDAYFGGGLREFSVPLAAEGTEFQRGVWDVLRAIPYGEVRSYAEQARAMGRPRAVRAVAAANGQNPISIIVPCHRVVGSDGRLTGYGGGLWRKQWLLSHERGQPSLQEAPSET